MPTLALAILLARVVGDPVGDLKKAEEVRDQGDLASAERLMRQAASEAPEWPLPMIDLAELLVREGSAAEARSLAETAVRLDPDAPRAWHVASLAEDLTGALSAAEASDRRALELRPGYAEAGDHLAQLLWNEGKRQPAIELYLKLVGERPGDLPLLATLASAEEEAGATEQAEQALRTLARIEPQSPVWHRRLARLLEGEGKNREAAQELAAADRIAGTRRQERHLRPLLPSKR